MSQLWEVALLTFIASFGIQFGFYLYYKITSNPIIKTHKSVISYLSGVIGDAILMPLVNILAVSALNSLNYKFNITTLLWASFGGTIVFFVFHLGQEYFKLTNWTMPENGLWNNVGVYHAIFMFAESTFLIFVIINFVQNGLNYGFSQIPTSNLLLALFVMLIFLITFVIDYWSLLFKKLF